MSKNNKADTPCVAKRQKNGKRRPIFCLLLSLALTACGATVNDRLPPPGNGLTVYLDAGHGDFDLGAVGVSADGEEVAEKDLSLAVALCVADVLRAEGHTVILSREDDTRLTYTNAHDEILARRAAALGARADLLLSIHVNAYRGAGRAYGPRVYYHPENAAAAACAERLSLTVSEHTGAVIGRKCRAVADGSYLILGDLTISALIFEVGFITDEKELSLLLTPDYQARLARGVADACRS